MESGPATVMTVVVTIFALFTDDIKRLVRRRPARAPQQLPCLVVFLQR